MRKYLHNHYGSKQQAFSPFLSEFCILIWILSLFLLRPGLSGFFPFQSKLSQKVSFITFRPGLAGDGIIFPQHVDPLIPSNDSPPIMATPARISSRSLSSSSPWRSSSHDWTEFKLCETTYLKEIKIRCFKGWYLFISISKSIKALIAFAVYIYQVTGNVKSHNLFSIL